MTVPIFDLIMLLNIFHCLLWTLFVESCCTGLVSAAHKSHSIGIIPGEGVPCPMEPCLTLSYFAKTSSDYLHSNITLTSSPGNHSLDLELSIMNIRSFAMLATSILTASTFIACEQFGKLTFNTISQVHVKGLKFIGCGGSRVKKVDQFILSDCILLGLKDKGSALELTNINAAYISNSSFISNNFSVGRHSYIGLHKITTGGPIIATHSSIKIMDSLFKENKAEVGAAIFGDAGSNITLVNSNFVGNFVTGIHECKGGVLSIQNGCNVTVLNCVFSGSDPKSETNELKCNGGVFAVFAVFSSTLTVQRSFLQNNRANFGGIVYGLQANITISDTTITDCFAVHGGALYTQLAATLTISNSSFSNCTAIEGAVIHASESTVTIDKDSWFTDNNATIIHAHAAPIQLGGDVILSDGSYGGVIFVRGSMIFIGNSNFHKNSVGGNGGVMDASDCTVIINGSSFLKNTAGYYGGVMTILGNSSISLSKSRLSNNSAVIGGGVIKTGLVKTELMIRIHDCDFDGNNGSGYGGVIYASDCTIVINSSNFFENKAGNEGGVMTVLGNANVNLSKSKFDNNVADKGGVIKTGAVNTELTINICDCKFSENKAESSGAVLDVQTDATIVISSCDFTGNEAVGKSGGVLMAVRATVVITNSNFVSNTASRNGGALRVVSTNTTITRGLFSSNEAESGAVMNAELESVIMISDTVISNNSADEGVLYLADSFGGISGKVIVSRNVGSIFAYQSKVTFSDSVTFNSNKAPSASTAQLQEGGAVTVFQSDITFNGACTFVNNYARNGGAVQAIESKLHIYNGTMVIANNTADKTGGGIYIYQSELNCQNHSQVKFFGNYASEKGGGIHAISSSITVDISRNWRGEYLGSLLQIIENRAENGGGICLEVNAKISIIRSRTYLFVGAINDTYTVEFIGNSADNGGAVYVADDTNSGTCTSSSFKDYSKVTECFLQTPALKKLESFGHWIVTVLFDQNVARVSGESLYGGLLDRCTISPFANPTDPIQAVDGFTYFKFFIDQINIHEISSNPVQVCFCRNGLPDCRYQHPPVMVKKGEVFKIQLVAVDQVYHMISAYIRSSLSSTEGGLGEDQLLQFTNDNCTELSFQVFSPKKSE